MTKCYRTIICRDVACNVTTPYKFQAKLPLLLIHRDVMYAGFAGAKTSHAQSTFPKGKKKPDLKEIGFFK